MSEDHKLVRAGFDAEALDPAIKNAIDRLDKTVVDIERIRGAAEPLLDRMRERVEKLVSETTADTPVPELALALGQLVEHLERYARVALNLTKVVDESARLRSFVAGGSDSKPDLSSMSDSDLAKYIRDAAKVA